MLVNKWIIWLNDCLSCVALTLRCIEVRWGEWVRGRERASEWLWCMVAENDHFVNVRSSLDSRDCPRQRYWDILPYFSKKSHCYFEMTNFYHWNLIRICAILELVWNSPIVLQVQAYPWDRVLTTQFDWLEVSLAWNCNEYVFADQLSSAIIHHDLIWYDMISSVNLIWTSICVYVVCVPL